MKNISNQILSRIYGLGRGAVIAPNDFVDIAGQLTILKSLSRLTNEGKIRRLMRGIYEYPAQSRILKSPVPPDPDAIARAIARSHGWTIVPTGNSALNRLGLSTQVPAQWQYFTDGPDKRYSWEGRKLLFKHRTIKEVSGLSPKTALLVQALKALGKDRTGEAEITKLCSKLNEQERACALREARHVTSWVYEIIKHIAHKESAHA